MSDYRNMQKPLWRLTASERRFIILLGDLLVSVIALFVALYFWAQQDQWLHFSWQFLQERPPDWYFFLPLVWIILLAELYDVRRAGRIKDVIQGILFALLVSGGLYLLLFFISSPNSLPRRGVAGFLIAAALLTFLWRIIYIKVFTAPVFLRRVLIIGAGRAGSNLSAVIKGIWPPPYFLVGFIDDDPKKIGTTLNELPIFGGSAQLLEIIKKDSISDLIFSISGEMKSEMSKAILAAEESGVVVTTMPVVYEELLGRVPINLLQDDWILRTFLDESHSSGSYEVIKRIMDIFFGLTGLIVTIILFPLISFFIVLDSGFPILFIQKRLGKSGKPFKLFKFRTMTQDAEKDGIARLAVENDERVTRIGRFLRKSRMDEFPQFFNLLRGDVSMVGPRAERPELVEKMQKKIPFYRARLFVKPGVTGWAQVNYHYASNLEETAVKLEYDLYYIKHRNLLLDVTIIIRTIATVLRYLGQ
jgi:exopolysaccharide biosynthesis polyprenyl glycosylphosphotransferase